MVAVKRAGVIVTLGALLSMVAGVVTASPAFARGEGWQIQPAPPAIIVPATFCGFEIQVTFPVDREFAKILTASNGFMTTLVTGSLFASLTNLETGKTITENISGPSKTTVFPNGSMTTTATGLNPVALSRRGALRITHLRRDRRRPNGLNRPGREHHRAVPRWPCPGRRVRRVELTATSRAPKGIPTICRIRVHHIASRLIGTTPIHPVLGTCLAAHPQADIRKATVGREMIRISGSKPDRR